MSLEGGGWLALSALQGSNQVDGMNVKLFQLSTNAENKFATQIKNKKNLSFTCSSFMCPIIIRKSVFLNYNDAGGGGEGMMALFESHSHI